MNNQELDLLRVILSQNSKILGLSAWQYAIAEQIILGNAYSLQRKGYTISYTTGAVYIAFKDINVFTLYSGDTN